jgi:hypothetical protein
MPIRVLAVLASIVLSLAGTASLWAKPPNRQGLKNHYGEYLPNSLNACTTCHVAKAAAPAPATFEEHPPHNAFGVRLRELGEELREAGKPADIITRLRAIADEDSDGDGVANEMEIFAGHAPGRADDRPTEAGIAIAFERREEFRRTKARYAWQPFAQVERPIVPAPKNSGWMRNPIDAFIAAEREARRLEPRPEAAKHVLLRRVYLDLIGLQPTPDELDVFLADSSPDAYERVVEKLLNSPQYGERWGRHWMDVWRYSDWAGWTGGNQIRDSQPHIWRWRDWIIESLNADKPYDRMILEMLAGDEIEPTNPDVLRATGYLVRNYKMLSRETWMQDTVKHTAQAFLGVTLDCARCHDHQYDPISQREYYQFRAIFEPHNVRLDRRPGEPDTKKDGFARTFDAEPAAQTFLFVRGDDRNPDKSKPVEPGVPSAVGGSEFKFDSVNLPLTASVPEKLDFIVRETLAASEQSIAQARTSLESARDNHGRAGAARDKAAELDRAAQAKLADVQQRLGGNAGADTDKVPSELKESLDVARKTAAELAKAREAADSASKELSLTELTAEVAAAKHAALEATIRVEQLEDSGGRDREPESFAALATVATSTQRWSALLEGNRNVQAAQHALEKAQSAATAAKAAAENSTDKKLQDAAQKTATELTNAQNKLAEAEKSLAKAKQDALLPATAEYAKRPLKTYPATSTGRRLALARWIADKNNPLTARVAVNHLWLRHFGQPLVPSVFDFGQNGRAPSHPALVDWLAAELMDPSTPGIQHSTPWSMKHIHRLIVTSATYRMASTPDDAALAADPDNQYYWRMNSRRLEAELVRDNVLWSSGQLDQTFGGPDIDHNQGLTAKRRSLYFRHAAEKQMEFLKIFDAASVGECYERKESVVPQQALALANSELSLAQSRLLARSLAARVAPDPAAFAAAAFERVLARPATPAELETATQFLIQQERRFGENSSKPGDNATNADTSKPSGDPALRARENLVHALMNHNDFVTVR